MIYNYKNYTPPIVVDFASNVTTGKCNFVYWFNVFIKKKIDIYTMKHLKLSSWLFLETKKLFLQKLYSYLHFN